MMKSSLVLLCLLIGTAGSAFAKEHSIAVRGKLPVATEVKVWGAFVAGNPVCGHPCVGGPLFCRGAASGDWIRMTRSREIKVQTVAESDGNYSFNARLSLAKGFCAWKLEKIGIWVESGAFKLGIAAENTLRGQANAAFEFNLSEAKKESWPFGECYLADLKHSQEVVFDVICRKDEKGNCVFKP